MATITGILTAVATILGAFVYFSKTWKSTPEDKKQKIDEKVGNAKDEFEKTGRPSE